MPPQNINQSANMLKTKRTKNRIAGSVTGSLSRQLKRTPVSGPLCHNTAKGSPPATIDNETGQIVAPEDMGSLINDIKSAHADAIRAATTAVQHSINAGEKLCEVRHRLEASIPHTGKGGPKKVEFAKWVKENLPVEDGGLSWRTAYIYIQLWEGRAIPGLTECHNQEEALAMIKDKQGHKPRNRDKKQDTWVSQVQAVERFFEEKAAQQPLEEWDAEFREYAKGILKNLASWHRKL